MSNFDDREPGYYWIQWRSLLCDGGGVVDEKWTEPEVALLNRRGLWMLVGSEVPLCFDVEIIEAVTPPAVRMSDDGSAVGWGDLELPTRGKER